MGVTRQPVVQPRLRVHHRQGRLGRHGVGGPHQEVQRVRHGAGGASRRCLDRPDFFNHLRICLLSCRGTMSTGDMFISFPSRRYHVHHNTERRDDTIDSTSSTYKNVHSGLHEFACLTEREFSHVGPYSRRHVSRLWFLVAKTYYHKRVRIRVL